MKYLASLLTLLFIWSTPAAAEPPGSDFYGAFKKNFLWCRDATDLKRLVDARLTDFEKSVEMLTEFHNTMVHNRPRCDHGNIGAVAVGEHEYYGVVPAKGGGFLDTWFVHVGNSDFGFWIFYTENLPDQGA